MLASNEELTIVLVEPELAEMPNSVVVHWPPPPSVADPAAFPELATGVSSYSPQPRPSSPTSNTGGRCDAAKITSVSQHVSQMACHDTPPHDTSRHETLSEHSPDRVGLDFESGLAT